VTPNIRTAHFLAGRLPFYYGWVIVGCAMCGAYVKQGGAVGTLSVFVSPMTEELGWSRTEISGAVSLGGILAALSAPMVGTLADRRGSGFILVASALLLGAAALFLSLTETLIWFYAAFCIARMTFAGPFDIGTTSVVAKWFVHSRARAMSYVNVVSSVSLATMPIIAHAAMQGSDWRAGWIAIAAVVLTIGVLPNLVLMVRQPEDIGMLPDRAAAPPQTSGGNAAAPLPPAAPEFTRKQALRTPALWLIMGYTAMIFPVQAGISLHQVPHLIQRGLSPLVAVSAVSLFAIISAVASLGFGYFDRRVSSRMGLFVAAVFMSASAVILIGVTEAWHAYASMLLFGAGIGGIMTLTPVILADYFGRNNYGAIRGIALPVQVLFQATGPLVAGALYDWKGVYTYSLVLFAGCGLLAAVLILFTRPPRLPDIPHTAGTQR
jgi:MFS transporter, OFA family, oxalate/formate antiporter